MSKKIDWLFEKQKERRYERTKNEVVMDLCIQH